MEATFSSSLAMYEKQDTHLSTDYPGMMLETSPLGIWSEVASQWGAFLPWREGLAKGTNHSHFSPDPSLEQELNTKCLGCLAKTIKSPVILTGKSPISVYIQGEHRDLSVQRGHCGKTCHPATRALRKSPDGEFDPLL